MAGAKGSPVLRHFSSASHSILGGLFDEGEELAMHGVVSGQNLPMGENVIAAVDVGYETAGFAHHDDSRRRVPRRKIALPISVESPGRNPGEVERGGPEAAQPRDLLLDGGEFLAKQRQIAAAEVPQPPGDHRRGEPLARCNTEPLFGW